MSLPVLDRNVTRYVGSADGRLLFRYNCTRCGQRALSFVPVLRGPCFGCFHKDLIAAPPKGFWLYRLQDGSGRLVYIGVTRNPRQRIKAHFKQWGRFIRAVAWERCVDEADMLRKEALAIAAEFPAFNLDHPKVESFTNGA